MPGWPAPRDGRNRCLACTTRVLPEPGLRRPTQLNSVRPGVIDQWGLPAGPFGLAEDDCAGQESWDEKAKPVQRVSGLANDAGVQRRSETTGASVGLQRRFPVRPRT